MTTKQQQPQHALRAELHGAGLRATPARLGVLEVLRAQSAPMSHSEVASLLSGRGWDRATVFRNLITLVEAGFVRRTDLGDHVWRFEALGEGDDEPHEHAHFLCTGCGEVSCMPGLELRLPRGIQVPHSVRAQAVDVKLQGLCDACR